MNRIERIESDKEQYLALLLEADPDRDAVMKYLPEGELFVLFCDGDAMCAAVVTAVSETECELKNIAALQQGRGLGSAMIGFLAHEYQGRFRTMVVGTANTSTQNIRFYKKNGFCYSHTIKDFFIENYEQPIYEHGERCVDMICLKKSLDNGGER